MIINYRYIISLMKKDTDGFVKPKVFVRSIENKYQAPELLANVCTEFGVPYVKVTGTSGQEGYKTIRLLSIEDGE